MGDLSDLHETTATRTNAGGIRSDFLSVSPPTTLTLPLKLGPRHAPRAARKTGYISQAVRWKWYVTYWHFAAVRDVRSHFGYGRISGLAMLMLVHRQLKRPRAKR